MLTRHHLVLHLHHSYSRIFRYTEVLEEDTWNKTLKPAFILYHICQADTSRAYAYGQALLTVGDETPAEDSAAQYVKNPNKRHEFCRHLVKTKEERQNFHLSLNVLGTCRQLYEEANHLLWSTNTFTFNEPEAFELFFSSLNPAQKRNLTQLGFFASLDTKQRFVWERAFRPANLKMLQGLTTLSLRLEQHINESDLTEFNNCHHTKYEFWWTMNSFVHFRMLPLKQVVVTISDDVSWLANIEDLGETNDGLSGRWTAVQKIQFARDWEEILLDTDPAATIEAEEDAAEVDAREAFDRLCANSLKTQQDNADFCEAAANAAAASLEEARLEPARVSSSMQTDIESIIEEREAKARYSSKSAVAALKRVERLKLALPGRIDRAAALRKAGREARKRRQVVIKSRATATPS